MRRIICIVSISLTFIQTGCKQEINPKIDTQTGAIVVEGLVTNLRESYKVKISMATAYDSLANNSGLLGATVTIKDDLGNSYMMHEESLQRVYYSDTSEFIAVPGRSYTLFIEMPNGDSYESSAQKLTPPASIDSVYGDITNKEYLYNNALGQTTTKMVSGSETFMDLSYNSDSIIQFRFDNTLMKCYSYWYWYTPEMKDSGVWFPPPNPCFEKACPYVIYAWQKFFTNTTINLSNTTNNFISKLMKNSSVCFFPFDNAFFPIMIKKDTCGLDITEKEQCIVLKGPSDLEGILLQTRVYALNKGSAIYYKELNDQLSSEGKLFDPIAVQLQGNIKCVNNPKKLALGLFEVSSCTKRSLRLLFNYIDGTAKYQTISDISTIPNSGSGKDMPAFWQLFFQ
jgi:hypothetical protein